MIKSFFENLKSKVFHSYFISLVNINSLIRFLLNSWFLSFVLISENNSNTFSYKFYIFATMVIIVQILLCGGFIFTITLKKYKERENYTAIDIAQDEIKEIQALKRGNLLEHCIFNFEYVSKIESSCRRGNEIWVITGDLEEDVNNTDLVGIIRDNLDKGVTYRYFISKVDGGITPSANLGKEKLKKNHQNHFGKKLHCTEIPIELIAPDVDIIIYNATNLSERRGFVCIEIGNKTESYAYQELEPQTVQKILDVVSAKSKQKNFKLSKDNKNNNRIAVSIVLVAYNIISVFFFAVLSFSKILSFSDALFSILPAVFIYILTHILICGLDHIFIKYNIQIDKINQEKGVFNDVLSESSILDELKKIKILKQQELLVNMQLGEPSNILKVASNCKTIWILSDLSHDIAAEGFSEWLENVLKSNSKVNCNILYIDSVASKGRLSLLENFKNIFPDRINTFAIKELKEHCVWSETYGIVFFECKKNKHEMFVSLGCAEDSVFKKVITNEEQAAIVLGMLKKFTLQ